MSDEGQCPPHYGSYLMAIIALAAQSIPSKFNEMVTGPPEAGNFVRSAGDAHYMEFLIRSSNSLRYPENMMSWSMSVLISTALSMNLAFCFNNLSICFRWSCTVFCNSSSVGRSGRL